MKKREIEILLLELKEQQEQKVLQVGRTFIPTLTTEDVLQPIDYPELEQNPHFRYEEGVLAGIHTARAALLALLKEED